MKQILGPCLSLLLWAAPVGAQDGDAQVEEGFDLLQEGMGLLLEGLMRDIGPALQDLEGAVIDLNAYHFPEVLPNGDIIIRRKTPLLPPADGETDL